MGRKNSTRPLRNPHHVREGAVSNPELEAPWRVLDVMGRRASQALGQNFLRSPEVARQIVVAASLNASEVVLEIGPGLGALTGLLLRTGATVIGVEKDGVLAARLRERFLGEPRLTVLEADALTVALEELPGRAETRSVVANLPYYVAVPLVFRLLTPPCLFRQLIVMVQLEVAERMAAEPGHSEYGAMTVHLQRLASVSTVLDVPPEAFFPIPKVRSRVVRIVPHAKPGAGEVPERWLAQVVQAAFAQRRKTLRNALTGLGLRVPDLERLLAREGVDPMRRGETLSLEEFCRISLAVAAIKGERREAEN